MPTVHLPQLWGVLYAGPNQDGRRKACANCRHADDAAATCSVVDASISPSMICGYHVERGERVPAGLAGLETVPGGTSCDRCRFFTPVWTGSGVCEAVVDAGGTQAVVAARGCCARWEGA